MAYSLLTIKQHIVVFHCVFLHYLQYALWSSSLFVRDLEMLFVLILLLCSCLFFLYKKHVFSCPHQCYPVYNLHDFMYMHKKGKVGDRDNHARTKVHQRSTLQELRSIQSRHCHSYCYGYDHFIHFLLSLKLSP